MSEKLKKLIDETLKKAEEAQLSVEDVHLLPLTLQMELEKSSWAKKVMQNEKPPGRIERQNREKEKINAIVLHTVQMALELDNGFTMYDIERLAAGIVCLAKCQKIEPKKVSTQNLPREWDS